MKTTSSQFYQERADECRAAAAVAVLENVQRKHSDAEASWRAMADLAMLREKGE